MSRTALLPGTRIMLLGVAVSTFTVREKDSKYEQNLDLGIYIKARHIRSFRPEIKKILKKNSQQKRNKDEL